MIIVFVKHDVDEVEKQVDLFVDLKERWGKDWVLEFWFFYFMENRQGFDFMDDGLHNDVWNNECVMFAKL